MASTGVNGLIMPHRSLETKASVVDIKPKQTPKDIFHKCKHNKHVRPTNKEMSIMSATAKSNCMSLRNCTDRHMIS